MITAHRAALRVEDLYKSYGPNDVLKGVNLTVDKGTVHGLLGANGAGKSTLLGCLSGAEKADSGSIAVGKVQHQSFTPRGAFDAGIAIIYQHFQIIGALTVADNIFLGREIRSPLGVIARRRQEEEAARVLAELGVMINPAARVDTLSVGEQQIVEIARAVRLRPSVLILDEPTAALGAHEVESLLTLVRRLADERQMAIIYVTHLLSEVLQVADSVTILRDGVVHWTRPRSELNLADLAEAISPGGAQIERERRDITGEPHLVLSDFRTSRTGPVNLKVRPGEVVGVYGLLGSGRTDLLETIAGVRKVKSGTLTIGGEAVLVRSPKEALRQGISLVAADRRTQSLFEDMSAQDNVLMPHFDTLARFVRNRNNERSQFRRIADLVNLTPQRPDLSARFFSGGNAQKLSVGRWMTGIAPIRCLLLDEPTQGVDIGSRTELYNLIREFAASTGAAVIFSSSDPDEIVALADSTMILVEGRVHRLGPNALTETELITLAQPESTEHVA